MMDESVGVVPRMCILRLCSHRPWNHDLTRTILPFLLPKTMEDYSPLCNKHDTHVFNEKMYRKMRFLGLYTITGRSTKPCDYAVSTFGL